MRAIIGILLACILTISCKDTDQTINVANNEKLRSILKEEYPSLNQSQIRIEVHDFKDITVLLGDKQLFAKTDDELKEISDNIGKLTYNIYIDNNYLNEGKVVFTPIETRLVNDDDPKREYNINYDDYAPKK